MVTLPADFFGICYDQRGFGDAELSKKIDATRVRVVSYQRPLGWRPNVYADQPVQPPQVNLVNVTLPTDWPHPEPQFLYLWAPGM